MISIYCPALHCVFFVVTLMMCCPQHTDPVLVDKVKTLQFVDWLERNGATRVVELSALWWRISQTPFFSQQCFACCLQTFLKACLHVVLNNCVIRRKNAKPVCVVSVRLGDREWACSRSMMVNPSRPEEKVSSKMSFWSKCTAHAIYQVITWYMLMLNKRKASLEQACQHLKKRFRFLHIKPYNKDIYDLVRCSTALLWWLVMRAGACCWRHRWLKTTEEHVHSDNLSKNTINARFKRHETRWMFSGVLSCTDTKTRSLTRIYNPKAAFSAASWNQQTAVSRLYIHD